ncbi:MAG TPA: carbamoyltransferase C-terminal domain-containing protein [Gemmatimonadaceae bacterium]
MTVVLGLGTEEDAGAALIIDGRIVAAVNEERLCRMKMAMGFPHQSLREVLRLGGVAPSQVDAVLVGGAREIFIPGLSPFEGWFQYAPKGFGGRLKRVAARFSGVAGALPALDRAYYAALAPSFAYRRRAIRGIARQEHELHCPVRFIDHHLCHVTSAAFTSGFDSALVCSVDGGGDGKSSAMYAFRDGVLTRLHETRAFDSLGNYYAYVTHLCGFRAMRHEGKITGLAAHGTPRYVPLLRDFIDEENGTLVNRGGAVFGEAIRRLESRLPRGWTREDLAASVQRHFEDVTCRYVAHWARRSGLRDVALAGGVFANVRVNEEVWRLAETDCVFIHPAMTDAGLAVGAALAACLPGILERPMVSPREPLRDVYLGPSIEAADVDAAMTRHGLRPEPLTGPLSETIAGLLVEGYVVARASGRMEYGPRALGNRTIMYQPTDPAVNDWLNRNLRRTEFMPFAPALLRDHRQQCFGSMAGAEHAAEFMTMTFHCTPWMQEEMKGVVHLDGTARPQLVRQDRNPGFHQILAAFHRRTGLPGIINTSFNMHEEPIVCSADDAVRAFLDGSLDYLALGDVLIRHPGGSRHPRIAVPAQPAGA